MVHLSTNQLTEECHVGSRVGRIGIAGQIVSVSMERVRSSPFNTVDPWRRPKYSEYWIIG